MPDSTPQKNNQKNTKDIQDFELGQSDAGEASTALNPSDQKAPVINRYNQNLQNGTDPGLAISQPVKVDPSAVDPSAPAPTSSGPANASTITASAAPVSTTTANSAASGTTTQPAKSATTTVTSKPASPQPPNPAAKSKAILGCLGAFGSLMLIFLVLSFVFLGQSSTEQSPIAKLLGVNQGTFINGLIVFVHTIFILISLVAFIFTMVGLFKASMAARNDKEGRRSAMKTSLIAGITLFLILVIWGFTYVYLDSKVIKFSPAASREIITTPENTLGLSAPIEVKFDAAKIPIDRDRFKIISHDWDFGDKSTGTSQIVTHKFTEKGTYDVKLVVTVENKQTGETSIGGEYHALISIENESLRALFKADPQSGEVPLEVEFDASESTDPDGNIDKYEWDFDGNDDFLDGKGQTIKNTFEKVGKYRVSLRVTSTTGEFDVEEKEIIVEEEKSPEAVISIADNPKIFMTGVNYVFNADNSKSPNGKINKYEWTFSDNPKKTETTRTISHIFKNEGTQEITLKVIDETGEENEMKKTIKVDAPQGTPKAAIKTNPALESKATFLNGKAPYTVVFDAADSTDSDNNIVDYKWDFENDGNFDSFGNVVSHTYTQEGTYTATLEVWDADNNIGKSSIVIKVEAQGIIPVISADKVDGNVPVTINFDASGSSYSKGQITSYKWDFGDGTPIKLGSAAISHKYTSIGNFKASVTVVGSDGAMAEKFINITVREIPLAACFVSVFEKGPAPLETSFDPGCSSGTITGYFWDFGDGATSTLVKPTHVFDKPGEYKVTLEVSDAQNTVNKAEVTITVVEKNNN